MASGYFYRTRRLTPSQTSDMNMKLPLIWTQAFGVAVAQIYRLRLQNQMLKQSLNRTAAEVGRAWLGLEGVRGADSEQQRDLDWTRTELARIALDADDFANTTVISRRSDGGTGELISRVLRECLGSVTDWAEQRAVELDVLIPPEFDALISPSSCR